MPKKIDSLICYKKIKLGDGNKMNFFLDKHSTQEGTWGKLTLESGELEFVFLDGSENKLSCIRMDSTNRVISIPPSCWHKVKPASKAFSATLEFYCVPHRYFQKKYGLGRVHGDLLYALNNYFNNHDKMRILDVGCGKGRNLLYSALLGHHVTGIDFNKEAIDSIHAVTKKEKLTNVNAIVHDLHDVVDFDDEQFDLVISTVSLQFLKAERISSLLTELQQLTVAKGMHFIVYPISELPFELPESFTYVPESKALYHFYQDSGWAVLEYNEAVGQLHRLDESGKPIQGKFGLLLAQKN